MKMTPQDIVTWLDNWRLNWMQWVNESDDDPRVAELTRNSPWYSNSNRQIVYALDNLEYGEKTFRQFQEKYPIAPVFETQKAPVGIIMAGNVPVVGYHDLLMTWYTGNRAVVKPSAKDIPWVEYVWQEIPEKNLLTVLPVHFHDSIPGIGALIATGSDNTARMLRRQYRNIPCLIRGNRFSAAVLTGAESHRELIQLSEDILMYYGLGCRSVSNLLVPAGWNPSPLISALHTAAEWLLESDAWYKMVQWEKAEAAMTGELAAECGSVVIRRSPDLRPARPGNLLLVEYSGPDHLNLLLLQSKNKLQCIAGNGEGHVPFGQTQKPRLDDFADGINTYEWLMENVRI